MTDVILRRAARANKPSEVQHSTIQRIASTTHQHWTVSALCALWLMSILTGCSTPTKKTLTQTQSQPTPAYDIAYLAHDGRYWQVWLMDANGQGQKQLTTSAYDKNRVSWYPGGQALLIAGTQGQLARIKVASGQETPITVTPSGAVDAALSPDGQRIAYSVRGDGVFSTNDIWVVSASGGQARKLVQMRSLQQDPQWSPDGQWLYFTSSQAAGARAHDIWRISLNDARTEQLTAGTRFHFDVALSGDGQLAYSSNRSGNYEIWVRTATGEQRQLTDNPALDAHPSWSPDNKALVFESTRRANSNIWKLSLADGQLKQLTDLPNGARSPQWRQ